MLLLLINYPALRYLLKNLLVVDRMNYLPKTTTIRGADFMHTKCTSKNQTTRLSSLLYSWALLVIILITAAQTPSAQAETLRLATTTSAASSGILDHLFTAFTKDSGIKVEFEAVGSGRAIRLGRDGSVDALITHAPAAEIDFIKSGDGVKRIPFMTNEYIIIGPSSDPANIQGSSTAALAFKKIAVSQSAFISRGDDSGTHKWVCEICRTKTGYEQYADYKLEKKSPRQAL